MLFVKRRQCARAESFCLQSLRKEELRADRGRPSVLRVCRRARDVVRNKKQPTFHAGGPAAEHEWNVTSSGLEPGDLAGWPGFAVGGSGSGRAIGGDRGAQFEAQHGKSPGAVADEDFRQEDFAKPRNIDTVTGD